MDIAFLCSAACYQFMRGVFSHVSAFSMEVSNPFERVHAQGLSAVILLHNLCFVSGQLRRFVLASITFAPCLLPVYVLCFLIRFDVFYGGEQPF